jgi:spore coat polysaccharide biosynthesis protein SpsF
VMIVGTVEARMTSTRLPGKMTLPIAQQPMLSLLLERLKKVSELDRIVVATTSRSSDDVLENIAITHGVDVFRGSENDVLGRVRGALDLVHADVCVEITGDCPLTDPAMVSTMIREFMKTRGHHAYVANTTGPAMGAPHGLDVQVFEAGALREIESQHQDAAAREHVSLPFYRDGAESRWRPRFVSFFSHEQSRSVWLSLDFAEDYELIRNVHEDLSQTLGQYTAEDLVQACHERPAMTRRCLDLRGW